MRLLLVALLMSLTACQHSTLSPYSGEHQRELKALSPAEVEAYLAGDGMGLAKVAELNGYPGPKHVLELAEQLELTDSQQSSVRESWGRMHRDAVGLGEQLVAAEKELDTLFGVLSPGEEEVGRQLVEIGILRGRLRHTHIAAHLQMKTLLNDDQVARYKELRGYGGHLH